MGDVFACQGIFLLGNFQGEDRFLRIERLIMEGNIIFVEEAIRINQMNHS